MPKLRPGRGPQTAAPSVTIATRITRQSPRTPASGAGVAVIDRGRRATLHIDGLCAVRAIIEQSGETFAVHFSAEALARAAFAALTAADHADADAATRKALRAAAAPEGFTPNDLDGTDLAATLAARGLATKHHARVMGGGSRVVYRITDAGRVVLAQLDAAAPTTSTTGEG